MDIEDLYDRFRHHPPTPHSLAVHERVRTNAYAFACVLAALPDSREKSLAITKLEEAMFWGNAAVARNLPREDDREG